MNFRYSFRCSSRVFPRRTSRDFSQRFCWSYSCDLHKVYTRLTLIQGLQEFFTNIPQEFLLGVSVNYSQYFYRIFPRFFFVKDFVVFLLQFHLRFPSEFTSGFLIEDFFRFCSWDVSQSFSGFLPRIFLRGYIRRSF